MGNSNSCVRHLQDVVCVCQSGFWLPAMGNSNSCVRHLRDVFVVCMGGPRDGEDVGARSGARADGRCVSATDMRFHVTRSHGDSDLVATIMAKSKSHAERGVETQSREGIDDMVATIMAESKPDVEPNVERWVETQSHKGSDDIVATIMIEDKPDVEQQVETQSHEGSDDMVATITAESKPNVEVESQSHESNDDMVATIMAEDKLVVERQVETENHGGNDNMVASTMAESNPNVEVETQSHEGTDDMVATIMAEDKFDVEQQVETENHGGNDDMVASTMAESNPNVEVETQSHESTDDMVATIMAEDKLDVEQQVETENQGGNDDMVASTMAESKPNVEVETQSDEGNDVVAAVMAESKLDVERRVESSESHSSQVSEFDASSSGRDAYANDWEVFAGLFSNEDWVDAFFRTLGYEIGGYPNDGSLGIGKKFAEDGRAEFFPARVYWRDQEANEWDEENGREWVLKVFKKGTPLKHLETQWLHGMSQHYIEEVENRESSTPKLFPRYFCAVNYGTSLTDRKFAFLMRKEPFDLRTLNDHNKLVSIDRIR